MTHPVRRRRRLRVLAVVPALALAALGLSALPGSSTLTPVGSIGADEYYLNYAEPSVQPDDRPETKGKNGVFGGSGSSAVELDRKYAGGNPVTAKQLAKLEAQAAKTGKNPRQIKNAKGTQVAKLLTILMEFNPNANDDFSNVMVPDNVFDPDASTTADDRKCVLGTVQNGPLHNTIQNPGTLGHTDNNSMWVPDFSSEHYNKMLYTTTGITDRVRTDLTGPDGKAGVDLAGKTMHNMYLEMSKGAYTVNGQASPWITMPHSEGWYAASRCTKDANGNWVLPRSQAGNGHPTNARGQGQLAIDAVASLAAADPSFPWADYDIEDQADRDGDGNFFEPDGVIDHLVLVHAGKDKSGGGGAQGIYSIWAHSSSVAGGATIPGTDLKVSNYIVQPEDSGVGVFAHEYGHDLGLPDLYDTSGAADSDVDFWDLMSSGSHSGAIFQGTPTHMGIWDKWVLGWADPLVITPGSDARAVQLGQTSRTPVGTKDGIKIDLPQKRISLATPHSGSQMWYSNADQNWADVKLTRTVQVPAAADAKFWLYSDYSIEQDWDYGFIELSTDGSTWSEQKVYTEGGALVTTPDNYGDPNGRMRDYGGKKYGLTGHTTGWRHDYVDLSAYAGQTVQVRLRYATDEASLEKGWFVDDLSVTGGGATTWSDDAEANNGWAQTGGTFVDTTGAGWILDPGSQWRNQYYLAEWRNFDGFDEGLKYTYDTTYSRDAWKVEKVAYNAPGMLLWYRDTTYGTDNWPTANITALPSGGSKGGLLVVDSHFDPLRRTGVGASKDTTTLKNLPSRPQSSNAAFTLQPTYAFKECIEDVKAPYSEYCTDFGSLPAVSTFSDSQAWYPGIEIRGSSLFYRDADASVVIPSVDNQLYSTRVVDANGNLLPQYYGLTVAGNTVLGTGRPGDAGVSYGVTITIKRVAKDNSYATIYVVPALS
ncbi:immune inhibitor A domain-containing protein [Hamadaea sp. NPDC051192]|uniref:immune inhibitor A domain-containing protein n=1 Tax=Hamadaea sp. NPDC051192 TaxID=3154940 RepID=UPI00342ED244